MNSASVPLQVLLIAPSERIVGGQSVQARRLLQVLNTTPGLRVDFQPFDAALPSWLERINYVRTVVRLGLYFLTILRRVPRYDVIHLFSAGYSSYTLWSLPALAIAKLFHKPIILNYRDGQAEDHLRNWRSALPTIRRFDEIISPSGFLVEVFAEFGLKARSIFNIIDMSQFRYRPRSRLRPVFLHNRILEPLYHIECSLDAFALVQKRYPEASLTVAHDGPSRAHLEQYVRERGIPNVTFIGKVPHSRVAELYDAADIYLTSPKFDCMPGSLLECFASGLPVIATAAGGIPFIASHDRTALIVPVGDHEAMAAAAIRLLEDPALVERLTAAAREECRRYDPEPVRQQWFATYQSVWSRRRGRSSLSEERSL